MNGNKILSNKVREISQSSGLLKNRYYNTKRIFSYALPNYGVHSLYDGVNLSDSVWEKELVGPNSTVGLLEDCFQPIHQNTQRVSGCVESLYVYRTKHTIIRLKVRKLNTVDLSGYFYTHTLLETTRLSMIGHEFSHSQ